MKKRISALALACLLVTPAAAADSADPAGALGYKTDTPMFGPGQPIPSEPGVSIPSGAAQPGYTATTFPIPDMSISSGAALSIDDVEQRVRSHNLQVLMMDQQLKSLEDMDVDDVVDALNGQADQLTTLAQTLQNMLMTPEIQADPVMSGLITSNSVILNMQAAQLKSQATSTVDQLEDQIDTLEEQFTDAENQLVFAAESTFLAIKSMEGSYDDLQRQRTTLAATMIEMQKRYDLGQISALQLQQTRNGMTQLESGIATLAMNIENTKGDLSLLLGQDPKNSYSLAALPQITDTQIASINYDRDLPTVLRRSTEVRNADDALDDARRKNDDEDYNRHAENAAQLTYDNTVNTVSQNFRKLCRAVTDKRQLVTAAQSDYALAQQNFQVEQTKFQNGQISQNTYDAAKATLETSANAVTTAQNNLYTAYMKYEWALKGIVSSS